MTIKALITSIYIETSVVGGMFDEEFRRPSEVFFQQVMAGRFAPFASELVSEEIIPAPARVKEFYNSLITVATVISINRSAIDLRNEYVKAGIVQPRQLADALHVAIATVAGIQLIVSWNFKHIVNFDKIPKYNAVNVLQGFSPLSIHSPLEVIEYEE